ncbi:sugar ABC transporter permease [Candidatus Bipolaricaulota bacterium]|nr:sugar ABC transporter permease [Candidatus Bipolaricaulota bacterium]
MEMKRSEFLAYVAPSFLIMLALMVFPLFFSIYLSFRNFTYGGPASSAGGNFVGFENYLYILSSSRFWGGLSFTLILVLVSGTVSIVLGLTIAILLYEARKGEGFFIAGYLLPYTVPPVVTTMVFGWLFRNNWGYVDYLLSQIGININWFASKWPARALLSMHTVWWMMPFVVLVFYAALQAMPQHFLEAARVDGASYLQRVYYVIIPYLKPLIIFVGMILIQDIFRIFDNVAVMTAGGPGNTTETLAYYNYQIAFGNLSIGMGSAISVVTLAFTFLLLGPFIHKTYLEQQNI